MSLYGVYLFTLWRVLQVQLTVPFSRTSFSTTASFEVRSPKRLQVGDPLAHRHNPCGLQRDLEQSLRCTRYRR